MTLPKSVEKGTTKILWVSLETDQEKKKDYTQETKP